MASRKPVVFVSGLAQQIQSGDAVDPSSLGTGTANAATTLSGANTWLNLFNNMGQVHATQADFNAISDFGWRFVQGSTNGPSTGASQFYGVSLGLGSDYDYSSYAMQLAIPRNHGTDKYLSIRFREATAWGSWSKIKAGYADDAGTLATKTWDVPGTIGSTTPNTGAFTTLSASSTVSGSGFSTYLASPPSIGSGTPSTGKFTTVESTIATGTAPFIVASTTLVSNLNAQYLNGNASSYYAPLSSPTFTGTPAAPTAAVNTDTTQLATTAFVRAQIQAQVLSPFLLMGA